MGRENSSVSGVVVRYTQLKDVIDTIIIDRHVPTFANRDRHEQWKPHLVIIIVTALEGRGNKEKVLHYDDMLADQQAKGEAKAEDKANRGTGGGSDEGGDDDEGWDDDECFLLWCIYPIESVESAYTLMATKPKVIYVQDFRYNWEQRFCYSKSMAKTPMCGDDDSCNGVQPLELDLLFKTAKVWHRYFNYVDVKRSNNGIADDEFKASMIKRHRQDECLWIDENIVERISLEILSLNFKFCIYYTEMLLKKLMVFGSTIHGPKHMSSATLGQARYFILEHLLRTLPMRDAHLKSVLESTIQMDLDELHKTKTNYLDVYLDKFRSGYTNQRFDNNCY
ncbi:hypothetical protein Tco_1274802 [Tanacetum coccineum]